MVYKICQFSELTERVPYTVSVNGIEVGVIKWRNELYAYENNCPHMGGPVCLGEVFEKINLELNDDKTVEREYVSEEDLQLVCPWHGFEFDLKTGSCSFSSKFKLRKMRAFTKDNDVYVEI